MTEEETRKEPPPTGALELANGGGVLLRSPSFTSTFRVRPARGAGPKQLPAPLDRFEA